MARPREFDEGVVLAAMIQCFWDRGYEATSVRDLVEKSGITAASLWIVDPNNESNGYADLVNAGYEAVAHYLAENNNADVSNLTSPFAESAVLTVNSSGNVVLAPLSEIGGVVSPTQMWISWTAPAQAAVRRAIQAQHRKSLARIGG